MPQLKLDIKLIGGYRVQIKEIHARRMCSGGGASFFAWRLFQFA